MTDPSQPSEDRRPAKNPEPGDTQADDSAASLYRLLIESVVDYALFVLDPTGHIKTWNPGAERLKGYAADEIIGRHFSVLYTPEDVAAGTWARGLRAATEEGRFEDEGWRVRKDGSRFWANVVITRLTNASGEIVGFAKITRDQTARRNAEETARRHAAELAARKEAERRSAELEVLNDQLGRQGIELESQTEEAQTLAEELDEANESLRNALARAEAAQQAAEGANRAKAEFLASMSHELRTPLNAIAGYIELIALGVYGPVTESQRDALQRAQKSQQRLLSLISDVLSFSKLTAGHVEYTITSLAPTPVVGEVLTMLEGQLAAAGIAYSVTVPTDLVVRADPERLAQILVNLLSNAIKFTPRGGRITIDGGSDPARPRMAIIRVSDTGIGIAQNQWESMFEPFVQGPQQPMAGTTRGTGLGLSISRTLARGMGGDLTVESIVGQGSTFSLTLPSAAVPH